MIKKAAVSIIFNSKRQVLLLKRTDKHPLYPNEWCFPGGKMDMVEEEYSKGDVSLVFNHKPSLPIHLRTRWEDYDETAQRETVEETGIRMGIFLDTAHRMKGKDYIIAIIECITLHEESEITVEFPNREHSEYKFYDLESLPETASRLVKLYVSVCLRLRHEI